MDNKRLVNIVIVIAVLLSIPFIAMQFTDQVNWNLSDFAVMAIMLSGTAFIYEFARKKLNKKEHRITLFLVLTALFLLFWVEMAVGTFGTPLAGN